MADRKIPNKLFFKIGEVCELTEIQPYVLRYWETEFPILRPIKNKSGQRLYRKKDLETILRIKELLYHEGYTIAGAQKKLSDENGRVAKLAAGDASPENIVRELYLTAYSRDPDAEELAVATAAFDAEGATRQSAAEDILWALLNSAEFVFNH